MNLRQSARCVFRSAVPLSLAVACFISIDGCNTPPSTQASTVPDSSAPTPSNPAPRPPAPVSDAPDAQPFTTTGPLVADQQADIASERDGRVVRVAVQLGDRVRRGQVLAMLDDRALRSACDSRKAKLASLQAQVSEWQAEQKSAEADLRRADIMRNEKIRSEEDWEHVKYKLDETIAEVARYRADVAAAQADLQAANLELEQSRIVAPFDGVVGRSALRVTQEVKKGDVLFWITAVAPLRVLFTVPESVMASFPPGAALDLTTAVYPQLRQPARVLRVSPVVDPASASVQVVGALLHPSPLLRPGMTMQVQAPAARDLRPTR